MKILKCIMAILILASLTSCDPPKNINLINNTDSDVYFKFKIETTTQNYHLKQLSEGDSIIVTVGPKKKQSLYLGMGDWSGNTINDLAATIKSFEIHTKGITTIYHSNASIQKILKDNKKGFLLRNNIDIEVSE